MDLKQAQQLNNLTSTILFHQKELERYYALARDCLKDLRRSIEKYNGASWDIDAIWFVRYRERARQARYLRDATLAALSNNDMSLLDKAHVHWYYRLARADLLEMRWFGVKDPYLWWFKEHRRLARRARKRSSGRSALGFPDLP